MSGANLKLLGLAVLWICSAVVLMALAGRIGPWFLVTVPALMVAVAVLSYRVRCHHCGWSLIKRGIFVAPYAPRSCPKCGEKVA